MSGFSFVSKKILELFASLGVLATLLFFLLKLLPGGPFDSEKPLDPLVYESLQKSYGLGESFGSQVFHYLTSLLQGDLGVSMVRPGQTVSEIIARSFSSTLILNSLALIIVVLGSLSLSVVLVRYRDGWFEALVDQVLVVCLSLPSLFWGPLLIFIFAFYWNLLPVALLESPSSYILPLVTLCLRPLATLVRLLKNSLYENLQQDYTRTAVAKGLSSWAVLLRHVLRNSFVAFISYLGPLSVSLISGSFMVELLFAVPGMGSEFILALNDRDYTLIAGLTLFYGSLLLIVNSAADILLRRLDPRMREEL